MTISLFSFEITVDSTLSAQLAAAMVGILVTVAWRLIDRYLPDPSGAHPSPPPPRQGGK